MKNQLLALTTVIGVTIIGGITSTPTLLPPTQAVTIQDEGNGVRAIEIGRNVHRTNDGAYINVPLGTKIYFVCKDVDLSYDAYQVSGSIKIDPFTNRSKYIVLSHKGEYSFNITNLGQPYNDSIIVFVK